MRNSNLFILLLLVCSTTIGQTMEDILNETCEQAVTRANKDSETGTLKSITYGLVIDPNFSLEYSKFREVYLISKYQIDSYEAGCVIIGNEECYADQMQLLIDEKYGENFFEEVEPEIRKLYERFNSLSQNEIEDIIDFDYTYGYGRIDERADFKEGWKKLYEELHEKIDFSKLSFEPYEYDRIGIRVMVDRKGNIEKCEVVSMDFPEDIGALIEKTVTEIGNWKPATLYGYSVKSDNMLSFPLSMK